MIAEVDARVRRGLRRDEHPDEYADHHGDATKSCHPNLLPDRGRPMGRVYLRSSMRAGRSPALCHPADGVGLLSSCARRCDRMASVTGWPFE